MEHLVQWLFGVMGVALAAMGIRQESIFGLMKTVQGKTLLQVIEKIEELRIMHEHPDDYGFGSKETNRLLRESIEQERISHEALSECCAAMTKQTNAVNELVRVMRDDASNKSRFAPPSHTGK